MKNLSVLLQIIVLLLALSSDVFGVAITNFGNSSFTIDTGTTDFPSYTQSSSSLNAVGLDTSILAGTFSPVDITGMPTITLTAAISGINPGYGFYVYLLDSTLTEYRTYTSFYSFFGSSPTTITLSFVSETATFTSVAGFQINGAGAYQPLNITFYNLEAVPEPQTVALLACGLSALFIVKRRRKAA